VVTAHLGSASTHQVMIETTQMPAVMTTGVARPQRGTSVEVSLTSAFELSRV
jgi:hypothetical protein